jgi:hypothetical protein
LLSGWLLACGTQLPVPHWELIRRLRRMRKSRWVARRPLLGLSILASKEMAFLYLSEAIRPERSGSRLTRRYWLAKLIGVEEAKGQLWPLRIHLGWRFPSSTPLPCLSNLPTGHQCPSFQPMLLTFNSLIRQHFRPRLLPSEALLPT